MIEDQTRAWFEAQYDDGDEFELVAIKDGNARRKTFTWGNDDLPLGVLDACEAFEAHGFDVYASALPLSQQAAGTYDRVWVDQDDLSGPWPWGTDPDLQWPNPTTLVRTSEEGGSFRWQAIWKLEGTMAALDARPFLKRLAYQIGADEKVHDARRILRVPGILNAKRGVPARLVKASSGTVRPSQFNLPAESTVQALMSKQVQNPAAILGEWLAGAEEGERNQKAYVCARFLRSCEVEYDDALAIVNVGAGRCSPPMDTQEVYNAVRSAYHAG
jgi:hypothetical protein